MEDKKYLTTKDVCKILDVSILSVYNYIKSEQLKAYKIGGNGNSRRRWRIKPKDLQDFIEKYSNKKNIEENNLVGVSNEKS